MHIVKLINGFSNIPLLGYFMKIFRNKTRGIVTKEYRAAMNTPKRAIILKKMYDESKDFNFNVAETEEQFVKRYKHLVVFDKYCPKLLECNNLKNCCICENLSKFIKLTPEEKIDGAKKLHDLYLDSLLDQIRDLRMKIEFFKTNEELQKELTELEDKYEKSNIKFDLEVEEYKNMVVNNGKLNSN